jgi:hypothetical protein
VQILILALPVAVFVLLRVLDATLPVVLGGLQLAVVAAYGLLLTVQARSRSAVAAEWLIGVVSLWIYRVFDTTMVDGAVNGLGLVVRGWSAMLRRAQSGSVRVYAASMLAGVVAMLGYFLWR